METKHLWLLSRQKQKKSFNNSSMNNLEDEVRELPIERASHLIPHETSTLYPQVNKRDS
jgi:hypothetical protein